MKKSLGILGRVFLAVVLTALLWLPEMLIAQTWTDIPQQIQTKAVRQADESTSIAVASTATVYTKSFLLDGAQYFSESHWGYSAAGTISVDIFLEQSPVAPTTEGAADGNFTVPTVSGSAIPNIATTFTTESTWVSQALSPVPLKYGRFKITGTGSNNADTIIKMYISKKMD